MYRLNLLARHWPSVPVAGPPRARPEGTRWILPLLQTYSVRWALIGEVKSPRMARQRALRTCAVRIIHKRLVYIQYYMYYTCEKIHYCHVLLQLINRLMGGQLYSVLKRSSMNIITWRNNLLLSSYYSDEQLNLKFSQCITSSRLILQWFSELTNGLDTR